jgi:hypothetical protein
MKTSRWKSALLALAFGPVLGLSFAIACSPTNKAQSQTSVSSAGSGGGDTTIPDPSDAAVDPDAADADSDAGDCVPTATKKCRPATFIALGSKCLTKCPLHNLRCDPRFWKGNCTHDCLTDADCQDTGSPGVCGKDLQCYRPCDPGPKPCGRTMYECVGDPGHTYCASSVPNPHLDGGADASADASDDAGDAGM